MVDGKVKTPVLDKEDSFMADGVRYWVEMPEGLSIERKLAFTKETIKIVTGFSPEGVVAQMIDMRQSFDKQQMTRVANGIETQIQRLTEMAQDRDPVIWAAALFINTKDEDRTKIPTDADRQAKIDRWNKEGVPYFFLRGCVETFSDTLTKLYAASTPTSPKPQKAAKRNPGASRTSSTSSKNTTKSSA